jgi:hypothetical protein
MVAQVIKKETLLLSFSIEDTEPLIAASGNLIKNGYIKQKDGKQLKCSCCGKHLKVENVGRFLPGSILITCDDPVCMNEYLLKKLV